MAMVDYQIIETELGPLISHSRSSVYDVMLDHDAGHDLFYICVNHNLQPVQVQIALEYIEQHRPVLEADLREILPRKAEYESQHRAKQAEVEKKIAQKPMTPRRAALYQLIEKNQRRRGELSRGELNGSGHSQ